MPRVLFLGFVLPPVGQRLRSRTDARDVRIDAVDGLRPRSASTSPPVGPPCPSVWYSGPSPLSFRDGGGAYAVPWVWSFWGRTGGG